MTPTEFKQVYPEFAAVADARVQFFIDLTDPHFDQIRWGDLYSEGVGCLVAHYLTVSAQQTAKANAADESADAIVKKAGDTELRFSEKVMVLQIQRSPLTKSEYGQQYQHLRRLVGLGALSV